MPRIGFHVCHLIELAKIRAGSMSTVAGVIAGRPVELVSAELLAGGDRVDQAVHYPIEWWLEADARNRCVLTGDGVLFEPADAAATADPLAGGSSTPTGPPGGGGQGGGTGISGGPATAAAPVTPSRRYIDGLVTVHHGPPRYVRAHGGGTKRRDGEEIIEGIAAVYYDGTPRTEFALGDHLVERIMPGAFDEVLKGSGDVLALFNHDRNLLLGRESSGTLEIRSINEGLAYRIVPGSTTVAHDVLEHIARRDVTGSSFSFRPVKETWTEDRARKIDVVEVQEVELFDVGPVTMPAYSATNAEIAEARNRRDLSRRLTGYMQRANNLTS